MIIGCDIDGVLTDLETYQLSAGEKYYKRPPVNVKGYKTWQIFGVTEKDDERFWADNIFDYAKNLPVKKGAPGVINKLRNDGHKFVFVTARTYTAENTEKGKEMRNVVYNWLKDNGVNYDDIVFSTEDKEKICVDLKLDLMIEDSPYNISYLKKHMPVICMEAGYNECCRGDGVITCKDWSCVYDAVLKIAENGKNR